MSRPTELLRQEMRAGQSVLLVGPPGTAKTSIIQQTARDCGMKTEVQTEDGIKSTIFRASLMERVDWTGCLIPNAKLGITQQLPFSIIKALQKVTEPTLLFIDDLGQAPMDVQASFMRSFDDKFFPDCVRIWAATNRPGDKAGVNSLCEPLRSRFNSAYVIPTPKATDKADGGVLLCDWKDWWENWVDWSLDNNAPPEIVAFHRSTGGNYLYQWEPNTDSSLRMADFRSWGAMIKRWNEGLRSTQQCSAVIGKACAAAFIAFASLTDHLPTPDEVFADPMGAPIPTKEDAKYLICAVLAQQVTCATAEQFVQYVTRREMGRVMGAYAVKDAYKRDANKTGSKVCNSKAWAKFYGENQELFSINK